MRYMSVAREQPPVERIVRPFQDFANKQASGGIVLIIAAAVALIWANSSWGESYVALWHTKLSVGVGDFSISKDLTHWINDGLMAVFFLVVGLEIKREVLVGELSSVGNAALPVVAALGGAVVPALIYFAINAGTEGSAGWGIPMATDIAFALGVLALLGQRAPTALKVLLTALAIVDDIVAVLVIALFYTSEISWGLWGSGPRSSRRSSWPMCLAWAGRSSTRCWGRGYGSASCSPGSTQP
jgi:Na+:H+ antiporter, NhaA family